MKTFRRCNNRQRRRRAGLAMLELVLYLPIMLFVMALMVNFGTIAAWKIRSQTNTRYAGWRTLHDRTGNHDPNPENWPQPASLSSSGGDQLDDVDGVWNGNAALTTPVVRGPALGGNGGAAIVVPGRFDMEANVRTGNSRVRRRLPMLPGILANGGEYGFNQQHEILDHRWDYRHLAMPNNPYDRSGDPGDGGNAARRAKRWYRIDPPFLPELATDLQNLAAADQRLKSNPTKLNLDPLDRDGEFYFYHLRRRYGFAGTNIPSPIPEDNRVSVPDFHPGARRDCTVDRVRMQTGVVDPLVRRIERLPGSMGRRFEALYESEIRRLQQMTPPPQAEIAALQQKLNQVQQFLDSLPMQNR